MYARRRAIFHRPRVYLLSGTCDYCNTISGPNGITAFQTRPRRTFINRKTVYCEHTHTCICVCIRGALCTRFSVARRIAFASLFRLCLYSYDRANHVKTKDAVLVTGWCKPSKSPIVSAEKFSGRAFRRATYFREYIARRRRRRRWPTTTPGRPKKCTFFLFRKYRVTDIYVLYNAVTAAPCESRRRLLSPRRFFFSPNSIPYYDRTDDATQLPPRQHKNTTKRYQKKKKITLSQYVLRRVRVENVNVRDFLSYARARQGFGCFRDEKGEKRKKNKLMTKYIIRHGGTRYI